jgi:putative oxidoreductase
MKTKMYTIFNPGKYPDHIDLALLLLRLTAGVFMLTHGMGKFTMLVGEEPIQFTDPIGVGETASLILAVFAEVFCSILLIAGIATRVAVIPLLITMMVAVFVVHQNDEFGRKELRLFYFMVYLFLAITGAGKISVDYWLYKRYRSVRRSR